MKTLLTFSIQVVGFMYVPCVFGFRPHVCHWQPNMFLLYDVRTCSRMREQKRVVR